MVQFSKLEKNSRLSIWQMSDKLIPNFCRPQIFSLKQLLPTSQLLVDNFEHDDMTSYQHGLAAKYNFKIAVYKVEFCVSFETNFV